MHESKKISINKQMAKGAIWMVSFKLIEKSIGLVSTIILARLLVPEDFGLVAMAMIVVAFIELMRSFNFDIALIQNQAATNNHYNSVWTMNVIASAGIAILMLFSAQYVASFYDEPRLLLIMYVLSAGVFISGFENVGVVAFRKELTFNKEFTYLLGKKLIGFVTSISLALYYANYWALIGGIVATRIGVVMLSYFVHPYRPRFCLNKWRELISFSAWLLVNNVLFFINNKIPELMVGKMLGPASLGVYSIGYEISNIPTTELVAPINRAVFPGYSKLNNDLKALAKSYLDTLSYIALLALPAAVGLAAISSLFVPLVLGDKWLEVIPLMQLLSIAGAFTVLQTNGGAVYLALGKPRLITSLMVIRLLIFIPLLVWLVNEQGLLGAGLAALAASIVMMPIGFLIIRNVLKIDFAKIISMIYRPVVASISMFYALNFIPFFVGIEHPSDISILSLVLVIFFGFSVYVLCLFLLWWMAGKPRSGEYQTGLYVISMLRKHF